MSPATARPRRLRAPAALLVALAGAACGVQPGHASLTAAQPTSKPGAAPPPQPYAVAGCEVEDTSATGVSE
ncbi:MAG: hypothetical protein ACYDAQ_17525 [Mycobacteriales bacterium]